MPAASLLIYKIKLCVLLGHAPWLLRSPAITEVTELNKQTATF